MKVMLLSYMLYSIFFVIVYLELFYGDQQVSVQKIKNLMGKTLLNTQVYGYNLLTNIPDENNGDSTTQMFRQPPATNIKLQASGLGSVAAIEENGPSYMVPQPCPCNSPGLMFLTCKLASGGGRRQSGQGSWRPLPEQYSDWKQKR